MSDPIFNPTTAMAGAIHVANGGTIDCATIDIDAVHRTEQRRNVCVCGHKDGDHQAAGIRGGLHAEHRGLCRQTDCPCRRYDAAPDGFDPAGLSWFEVEWRRPYADRWAANERTTVLAADTADACARVQSRYDAVLPDMVAVELDREQAA